MKLQSLIMLLCVCCTWHIQAEEQAQPRSIHISIDASTKSLLPQSNNILQQSELLTHQAHDKKNEVGINLFDKKPELKPINSLTSEAVKKVIASQVILLMAGSSNPWIFPAFITWRVAYALVSDDPIFNKATPEEAEELAKKGKKRVDAIAIFPILYHITRPSGK